MSKLLLFAGNNTSTIKDFMVENGTFDVPFSYESISKNINEIKNSIIKVDKMLYIYQPEMSIRYDMSLLQNLLSKSNFFDPGEIIFIANGSSDDSKAIEYFQAVMKSCDYKNYRIKKSDKNMTYAEIYDTLLGVSSSVKFKNKRKNIYRIENANDSKIAFLPDVNTDLLVEPFDYDNIINYEKAKEIAKRTESGIEHIDTMQEIKKYSRPSFQKINVSSILHKNKTIIVSGLPKSGITTWTCLLAMSSKDLDKSILILDYTNNQDVIDTLTINRIKYQKFRMVDLIGNYDVPRDVINVCSIDTENEDKVKFEFIQNFFSKIDTFEYVFIATDINFVEKIIKIVGDSLSKLFLCTNVIKNDINYLNKVIERVYDTIEPMIILSNQIKVMDDSVLLDSSSCKELLSRDCKVISTTKIENLHTDGYLSLKLLEV